jgi:hypothetical protein
MKVLRKQANHFISGAGSVLSILPLQREIKVINRPRLSDFDAIQNDWKQVGYDLMTAYHQVKRVDNDTSY